MRTLVVFYSYGGNTKIVAERLQKLLNADILEIETEKVYSKDYNAVLEEGKKEVYHKTKPKLKPFDVDVESYDQIVLGSPVWWYSFAPAMRTFLTQHNLAGKEVFPFATNGGWVGHIFADIQALCPNAKVHEGLDLFFSAEKLKTPEKSIDDFAAKIKK